MHATSVISLSQMDTSDEEIDFKTQKVGSSRPITPTYQPTFQMNDREVQLFGNLSPISMVSAQTSKKRNNPSRKKSVKQ